MNAQVGTVQWIDEKAVSAMTGFSLSTLRQWRQQGRGPAFSKIDRRSVRYRIDDVVDFMNSARVEPETNQRSV